MYNEEINLKLDFCKKFLMVCKWSLLSTAFALILGFDFSLISCVREKNYHTFADYPGFKEYYANRCAVQTDDPPLEDSDRELLQRYRPHLVLSPGGRYPIDFYKDYLPYTVVRRYSDGELITEKVDAELLKTIQNSREYYLDFQFKRFQKDGLDRRYMGDTTENSNDTKRSVIYGRVYRETVNFPDGNAETQLLNLIFLKYNLVFAVSGLSAELPWGYKTFLRLAGLDLEDWHELDNFVAIHIVLDEQEEPIAVLLAQHNHHRTYLIRKDLNLPPDGRLAFDIAVRSNEVYPASDSKEPIKHRVVRWSLYMKYLLSGEDPPFFRGYDVTHGLEAGGKEIVYDLVILPPCDPFYTAEMMLGEPRSFLGFYIGRDGPPGADYYTLPALLSPGKLLKFSYLRDGNPGDIRLVEEAIDLKNQKIDIDRITEHTGSNLYRDLATMYSFDKEISDPIH